MKFTSYHKLALVLGLLLLPLMISSESFWMDECGTGLYAQDPTLHAWWQHLNRDDSGDPQMPLSLIVTWLVSHTFGSHEWQLRAVNVFWGALALLAMYRAGKRLQLPWLPLLLAIQPYFWFYTNEARPYALELSCGAWLFAGLTEFLRSEGTGELWVWELSIAAVVLCLTTMLAPLPIAMTLASGAIIALKNKWKIHRKPILILLGAAVAAIPIGCYYLSTLARGAQGARVWRVDIKFFAYVIYELTGLLGLGPRVDSIRELARSPHIYAEIIHSPSQFLLPLICSILLLLVFVFGLRKWQPKSPFLLSFALVPIATSVVFVTVGLILQKAFWARHFAPVVPFYVALLGMSVSKMQRPMGQRLLTLGLIALLVISSLQLRFGPEHRKENYRDAAKIAHSALAEHKSIWWVANCNCAKFYGLEYTMEGPENGKVLFPTRKGITKFPPPDLIIYSKPDIFDPQGVVQNYLQQNQYHPTTTLNSIVIWSK